MKYLHAVKLYKALKAIKEENKLLTFEESQLVDMNLKEFEALYNFFDKTLNSYHENYEEYTDARIAIFKYYQEGEEIQTKKGLAIQVKDVNGLEEDLKKLHKDYEEVLEFERNKREILNEFLNKEFEESKLYKINPDDIVNISNKYSYWDYSSFFHFLVDSESEKTDHKIDVTNNMLISLYDKLGKTLYPLEGVIKYYTFLFSAKDLVKNLIKDIKVNDEWVELEEGYADLMIKKGLTPSVEDEMIQFTVDNEKLEEIEEDIKEYEENNKEVLEEYKESVSSLISKLGDTNYLECSKDIYDMLSKVEDR